MVMITNSFDKFPNEPTGLMYEQFGKIGLNPATTPAYNWDFSTTPTGWTELDSSKMGITGGKFHAKSISDNSNDTVYVNVGDLGDNWIIRMKAESVGYNAISSGGLLYIGLVESGDKADTWIDTNNLGIAIGERYGDGTNLGGRVVEGGSIISGGTTWGSSSSYIDMADNGSTVYLELKLVGGYSSGTFSATTYTDDTYSTVYSGGNNGANTNSITVGNASPSNTSSGLTYLVFKNPTDASTGSTSNYLEFNFDDLQIYSGVTSVEPASPKVKQHFIEWFSGKQLPSYWTFTDIYATNSGAMVDEVGGGYKITTATGGGNPTCSISFNKSSSSGNSNSNVCQYNYKGSVFNTVMKVDSITSIEAKVGLKKNTTGNFNHSNATIFGSTTLTNWACFSGDESGRTAVESNIPLDTNWNNHKLTLQTSNILYDINGVLKVTKTDRLPTVENLQPQAQMVSLNTDAKSLSIRYMEVYNT